MMNRWIQDFRLGLRQVVRRPGLALAVCGTIALGVAAVTAVFALADAALWKPLPVPGSDRLVLVHRQGADGASLALPNAIALRRELRGFDGFSVVAFGWALDLDRGETPRHLSAALTESQYFRAVAVPPLRGRLLEPRDDEVGAPPVVVLAERLWRDEFQSDPAIVGRSLRLSGVTATVVGVAPASADLIDARTALYVPAPPFAPWAPTSSGSNNFELIARVSEGTSIEAARAELAAVSARLVQQGALSDDKQLDATPLLQMLSSGVRRGLALVLAAAALVLALASVNVGALLSVRLHGRSRELAVRHALGARGGRILGQLLAEGAVLGLIGGALGVLVSVAGFDLLRTLAPEGLPGLSRAGIDARAIGVAVLLTLASVLAFAAWPALAARRRALAPAPAHGRTLGSGISTRSLGAFVVLEVALAAVLLIGAMLLLRSFSALAQVPLGFEPGGAIGGSLALPESGYSKPGPQSTAVTAIVDRLQATPGVESAGFITAQVLGARGVGHSLLVDGLAPDESRGARYRPFHGEVFEALGLVVSRGRAPASADATGAERVAWVNRAFVDRHLGGREPIGMRVAWKPGETNGDATRPSWMTIVGVVEDLRSTSLRARDQAAVYAPYLQREDDWIRFGELVARVTGDPRQRLDVLQSAVGAVVPGVALASVYTLDDRVTRALGRDRFQLQMVAGFGLVALLLGLQGVFGVVAYSLEQRRAEIGLRLALGLDPRRAGRMLLRQGFGQVTAGAAAGLLLALALGGVLEAVLYGVSARDPVSYLAGASLVLLAGFVAVWLPARRAARVDPLVALRQE